MQKEEALRSRQEKENLRSEIFTDREKSKDSSLSVEQSQAEEIETNSEKEQVTHPHDKGYKRIFSVKKNFLDFIKKYVSFDWMMDLTVDDIELLDKEYVTDQFDTYESDFVYKIYYNFTEKGKTSKIKSDEEEEKKEVYIFFLQEMQSRNDFTMPFRLLTYMNFIWLDYFKNSDKKKRKQKEYRLPAIIPLVLYDYKDNWTAQREFKGMIKDYEMFGEYVTNFRYILIDVKRLSQKKIKETNTLVDNVFLTEQLTSAKDWKDNIIELSRRVRMLSIEDQNAWITWFEKAFRNCSEEMKQQFLEQFRKGDDKMMNSMETILMEERMEGREEGRKEGILESVKNLMETMGLTMEQAMAALKVTEIEQKALMK